MGSQVCVPAKDITEDAENKSRKPDFKARIVFTGGCMAGKSSLISRYLTGKAKTDYEEYAPTGKGKQYSKTSTVKLGRD